MDWLAPRDEYCERLAPGLFAEPANALSNLAFLVAAVLLWRALAARRDGLSPWTLRVLAALVFLIGLGSAAYHVFAVAWAEVLDVLFIAVFIDFFVAGFARRRLGWPWWAAALAVPAFHAGGLLLTRGFAADAYNGSVAYIPALAGMTAMSIWLALRRDTAARLFAAASLVFAVSIALRSVDMAWCVRFPTGTHWAWHLLNALTLSLATLGLAGARPGRDPSRR